MPFVPCLAPTRLSKLTIAGLSALLLSACAGLPSAHPTVPKTFREPCKGPTSPMRTQGDKNALLIGYEGALQDCDAKRAGAVAIIDKAAPKRPWWQFRKPDS